MAASTQTPAVQEPSLPGNPTPHFVLMTIVGEVIFVSLLALASQASPQIETVVMTLLVGLWLAFLVNQGSNLISKFTIRS